MTLSLDGNGSTPQEINPERWARVQSMRLSSGAHSNMDDGMCIMEAVSYVSGEEWTDSPQCACPVIARFLRTWNDGMGDDDRQRLMPLVPRLVGTRRSAAVEDTRRWLITDWMLREQLPLFLRAGKCEAEAVELAGCDPIVSTEALERSLPKLQATKKKLAAARAARAAQDAALAAARAARAARAAALDAALDAAWDAARDAAWDAARDTLRPLVEEGRASALALVERLIAVGESEASK